MTLGWQMGTGRVGSLNVDRKEDKVGDEQNDAGVNCVEKPFSDLLAPGVENLFVFGPPGCLKDIQPMLKLCGRI